MTLAELRQSITALTQLAPTIRDGQRYLLHLQDAASAALASKPFAAYTKTGNTAGFMAQQVDDKSTRQAVLSIAFHAFDYCVKNSQPGQDFAPSRTQALQDLAGIGGVQSALDALRTLHKRLSPSNDESISGNIETSTGIQGGDTPTDSEEVGGTPSNESAGRQPNEYFADPTPKSLAQRLHHQLANWRGRLGAHAQDVNFGRFETTLRSIISRGEQGRAFGKFDVLESDLGSLRAVLLAQSFPEELPSIFERAQVFRTLAVFDFRMADRAAFEASRQCWLLSAFYNTCLIDVWTTNIDQVVHDVLGYLTTIQAEFRYAANPEAMLLLLRASHLICRIASADDLVPQVMYDRAGRIDSWVRYAIGTVLAISGPERVPPARVRHDARFIRPNGDEVPREQFAEVLLPSWTTASEREAACAIILELGGWRLDSAQRLLNTALRANPESRENWTTELAGVARRRQRVKVLKPNPWRDAKDGLHITCDENALAVLASDVIHRTFPSLESGIVLNGTAFRGRRVPTFLCSADFGPLGLFKVDSRERVSRESLNFATYAQRLHPRYRASRSDQSVAMISEPDDRVEFASGLLTSYVFTELEAPRTLNAWFRATEIESTRSLIRELFSVATKPWYQHSTHGFVDLLAEYDSFSARGVKRLRTDLAKREDVVGSSYDDRAIVWIERVLDWVGGDGRGADSSIERDAAQLQLCDSLRSVTHGDLHLDNILVVGNPGAEYPCLIDFETTGEGHLLKDFGRFSAALLFRTHEWSDQDTLIIRECFEQFAREDFRVLKVSDNASKQVKKVLLVIGDVWGVFLRFWRSGSAPKALEVSATLIASFLPYARYFDTGRQASLLALAIPGDLVALLEKSELEHHPVP